jgi:hypothetical protein
MWFSHAITGAYLRHCYKHVADSTTKLARQPGRRNRRQQHGKRRHLALQRGAGDEACASCA